MNPATLKALVEGSMEDAIAALTPGGIEAQEARGQRSLCESFQIPKRLIRVTLEELTALGFEVGGEADEIFYHGKLPAGWKMRPTKSSYWSDVVDDAGRNRFSVFYKAAFYDRKAHMSPPGEDEA